MDPRNLLMKAQNRAQQHAKSRGKLWLTFGSIKRGKDLVLLQAAGNIGEWKE